MVFTFTVAWGSLGRFNLDTRAHIQLYVEKESRIYIFVCTYSKTCNPDTSFWHSSPRTTSLGRHGTAHQHDTATAYISTDYAPHRTCSCGCAPERESPRASQRSRSRSVAQLTVEGCVCVCVCVCRRPRRRAHVGRCRPLPLNGPLSSLAARCARLAGCVARPSMTAACLYRREGRPSSSRRLLLVGEA